MRNQKKESRVKKIELFAIPGLPLIKNGDDLGTFITESAKDSGIILQKGDVVVIASKIVSKAEGRTVFLAEVVPTRKANKLAVQSGKDPRLCQLILEESKQVLFVQNGAIICEHKLGFVCTSAGVDRSNSGSATGEIAVLLPNDPDASARKIRQGIKDLSKAEVAVIISDSFGRPFRKASVGMAVGVAGINTLLKKKKTDLMGRRVNPEIAVVDEIAAAASLLMGQTNEGRPVVVVRRVEFTEGEKARIKDLLRPVEEDQIWE